MVLSTLKAFGDLSKEEIADLAEMSNEAVEKELIRLRKERKVVFYKGRYSEAGKMTFVDTLVISFLMLVCGFVAIGAI